MDLNKGEYIWIAIISVVLFFVLRELFCWYYKINERKDIQKDNNRLLILLLTDKGIKVPEDLITKYSKSEKTKTEPTKPNPTGTITPITD